MRNFLLTLLLFTSIFCFGQNEHLKFRDIEINGTLTEFLTRLTKIGYKTSKMYDGMCSMDGADFAGKESKITVFFDSETKIVSSLRIDFPCEKDWNTLKDVYVSAQKQLIQDYGNPTRLSEYFKDPFSEGDGNEVQAATRLKFKYLSEWELENGTITLQIILGIFNGRQSKYVVLLYKDKMNEEKEEREKLGGKEAEKNHLTFRDIEFNGKITEFINKLSVSANIQWTTDLKNICTFGGNFIGELCKVSVFATPKTKKVYEIWVNFPERQKRDSINLISDYRNVKAQIIKEYGNPISNEFFNENKNRWNYESKWELEKGEILLDIFIDKQVNVKYRDRVNKEIYEDERKDVSNYINVEPTKNDIVSSEHLKFRDIEIDGTATLFLSKLKTLGYILKDTDDGVYLLDGKFGGKECDIYFLSTEKTKTVWKVAVFFEKKNSWSSLKSDYNSIKEQLITKYGKPKKSYNFFSNPYYEGDGYELQAVKNEKCTYFTTWELVGGAISLQISGTDGCRLVIQYEDKTNMTKMQKEKEEIRREQNKKMQDDL